MSYLRALVRKTQAQRLLITPRASMPAAGASFAIDETVEDVVAIANRPAPPTPIESSIGAVLPAQSPATRDDTDRQPDVRPDEPGAQAPHVTERPLLDEARVPPVQPVRRSSRVVSRLVTTRGGVAMPDETAAPPPADRDARLLVVQSNPPLREPVAGLPWRDRPEARAHSPPTLQDRPVERPDVQISIGRLEVRAHVTAPAKPERPAPFRPQLTLQDYLARRSGER
jgi:hypothetical protein